MSDNLTKAIEAVKSHRYSFCKFISPNDAGDTGGHQGGLYIPKNSIQLMFDKPGIKGENMEKPAEIEWHDGSKTECRFIYYGKGTRNEYRITRLGRHFEVDDLVIIVKANEEKYIGFVISEPNEINSFLGEFGIDKHETNALIPVKNMTLDLDKPVISTNINPTPENNTIGSNTRTILNSGFYYIKPAANHILTVGKGIIKDAYTAILELVKNSYDADAEKVEIKIKINSKSTKIRIEDDGHGMSYDTVITKWMVPSTSAKVRQKKSLYKKRPLQGRKGIGRYAASILGDELLMQTTERDSLITTEVLVDWSLFNNDDKYLEDVDILIESYMSVKAKSGTILEIQGDKIWTDKELDELISTLKRLLSPFDEIDNDFGIFIEIKKEGSPKYFDYAEQIKPLPILEYYHYRIFGQTERKLIDGKYKIIAHLTLENQYLVNILPVHLEKVVSLEDDERYCGDILLDIRAFDLDEELPIRNNKINPDEAKRQLKELPGIAVIREGFRVRPYGDKKEDWLGLNERRYNSPTTSLSTNQVAGYVNVKQEDESHLVEKATREGFKEDEYYEGLKSTILQCLKELEILRYKFRKEHHKGGRRKKSVLEQIEDLSNLNSLNEKIQSVFFKANIPTTVSTEVTGIIEKEAKEREIEFEDVKRTIAQYQGQVTLGKIVTVVLHEGRKPLNGLRHHPKFIEQWSKEFLKELETHYKVGTGHLKDLMDKIVDRLNDNKNQAEVFVSIFKKLEPLAAGKRPAKSEFKISKPITEAFNLFEYELKEKAIKYEVVGDIEATVNGWEVDFYIAFANLIENSIYWLSLTDDKEIYVKIMEKEDEVEIDYADNGTGIDEVNIASQDIFDPGFSTKTNGTGLGLSITGEALERNNGKIRAVSSQTGANFIIQVKKI